MYRVWSLIGDITSYGPAGEEIILATLRYHIFSLAKNASDILAETLDDASISEKDITDRTPFWKNFDPTSFLLEDFIHFVAGPFVANVLISEDQGITAREADVVRRASTRYGRYFHPANDHIDDLVMSITVLQRVCNSMPVFISCLS